MQSKFDRGGRLDFWVVLPTESLRDLVYHSLRKQFPQLNYCVEWLDANGYGLHLTVVDWHPQGGMYHCPPSKRIHEERGVGKVRWPEADVREAARQYGWLWRTMLLEFGKMEADGTYGRIV